MLARRLCHPIAARWLSRAPGAVFNAIAAASARRRVPILAAKGFSDEPPAVGLGTGLGATLGAVGVADGAGLKGAQMAMVFTCAICETRSTKIFGRHSYEKGTVIVTCPGCGNHHLVADHLGWFQVRAHAPRTVAWAATALSCTDC